MSVSSLDFLATSQTTSSQHHGFRTPWVPNKERYAAPKRHSHSAGEDCVRNQTAECVSATHPPPTMPGPTKHAKKLADGAVFAAPAVFVVLWASGFIGAEFGLPYAGPMTFLTVRMSAVVLVIGLI